jgi:hypothetical protein
MKTQTTAILVYSLLALAATRGMAQPTPAPTTGDAACAAEPKGAIDTVASEKDADGFYSLFNGKDFTGWWQSCQTTHSEPDPTKGAIFRVDAGKQAIYSTQRGTNVGGILMTKKKFGNYEIIFDLWPDFGNDGGLFNRTPPNGRCFQTVLDYIDAGSLGGTWGEGGFPHRDFRPFAFSGNEKTISLSSGKGDSWSAITAKMNPTSFGCPAGGCGQTEWNALWNMDDWNQIRVKFYDGLTAGKKVHMLSWFRKYGATTWVPVSADTTFNTEAVPANYIGLQVHKGGRFGGAKGTWYRNIKWRPLDDSGKPIDPVVGTRPIGNTGKMQAPLIRATANALTGSLEEAHEIRVKTLQGKTLEVHSGPAGAFNYPLSSAADGLIAVEIKTASGTQYRLLNRLAE